MTEDEIKKYHAKIDDMGDDELALLDPICDALRSYQRETDSIGIHVVPNRVIALACVDQMRAWEKTLLLRD